MFLHSVSTFFDNSKLQLSPHAIFINYDARLGHYFCLYHWQDKYQLQNFFAICPAIQQHVGSWLPHHWI